MKSEWGSRVTREEETEDNIVAPGGPVSNTQGKLGGGYLVRGEGKAVQEGQPIRNGRGSVEVDRRTGRDVGQEKGN